MPESASPAPPAAPSTESTSDARFVSAWHESRQSCPAGVVELLGRLLQVAPPSVADHFYGEMLDDPAASRFLSPEQVRERLKPSLQRWLRELLGADAEQVDSLLATQRHVGAVHARIGVPVDLVLRGTRLLKADLFRGIVQLAGYGELACAAIGVVSSQIDFAMEAMSQAYANARERSGQIDTSYRLFSLIQNVATERERQRALLLAWENNLLYTLASHKAPNASECNIGRSEFGLWFVHKGAASFGETPETRKVGELMAAIDAELRERLPGATEAGARLAMLEDIRAHVAEIRGLTTLMFDSIGDVEAGRDALTSLLNRRFLPTVLRREIHLQASTGNSFAVLMVDLDHFKQINDNHGHEAGDRALKHVAALLSQHTRSSDYLFRFGGEEFIVVLGSVSREQARAIAEGLRERIAEAALTLADGSRLTVTASIGVALQDGHPDYERVLARADAAMYQAKRAGRDRVVMADGTLPEPPDAVRLRQP